MTKPESVYPPIEDYALISDCHCAALVSCNGSIDWCCMPRIDDDSFFGRLLDWNQGGFCAITPTAEYSSARCYVDQTMILETRFKTATGEVRLYDFFAMDPKAAEHTTYDCVRIVDGISGEVDLLLDLCPRFDYGEVLPHIRRHDSGAYVVTGSNKGLIIHSNLALEIVDHRDLTAKFSVHAGERIRMVIEFQFPELIEQTIAQGLSGHGGVDDHFARTRDWWQNWAQRIYPAHELDAQTLRSAITLKALTFDRTGAIAAAATTSLPEWIGGERNWDYRFCWIRDSVFTVRALHELGCVTEADRFHEFIQRSSAGNAEQMQIMYGVDGKRRLTEIELDWLEGYRESSPVRIGNGAARQSQLDVHGDLLEIAWERFAGGYPTAPDYWSFLVSVVDQVCKRWREPDHGIWEVRGTPRHYVHSKAMCWAALNRGIMLAQGNGFQAPFERWSRTRDEIRQAIEHGGYDARQGVFVQAFGGGFLDAALLLLPRIGFVDYLDPRMLRTTDAICQTLDYQGLLRRYSAPDELPGPEGAFLPCTFWLVVCLACQGRQERAASYYRRALDCANDIGLFSEEFDVEHQHMLGNFPQGLTHVSQIMAKLALRKAQGDSVARAGAG